MRRYAYFPGCSAKGACRELDLSTRAVAAAFGAELVELPNPGCTGARQFRIVSERLHLLANGRILALAERHGSDLVVVCDTCLLNLIEAGQRLETDPRARESVNGTLAREGLEFRGRVAVKHFLWVLMEDVGEERLRAKIVRSLRGLRVAPFYGCHILRPSAVHADGPPARATYLERLCQLLGAEAVAYEGADKCCGFHVLATTERTALRMSGGHLSEAQAAGAQCVVTPCPLCHTVLDAFQPEIERSLERPLGVPVLHVAQLVGLALGLPPRALGLSRHVVDAGTMLGRLAL